MTMIDPAIVPQRTLYTGAKMPAVGMGTFGSDHADADAVSAAVASVATASSCFGVAGTVLMVLSAADASILLSASVGSAG